MGVIKRRSFPHESRLLETFFAPDGSRILLRCRSLQPGLVQHRECDSASSERECTGLRRETDALAVVSAQTISKHIARRTDGARSRNAQCGRATAAAAEFAHPDESGRGPAVCHPE